MTDRRDERDPKKKQQGGKKEDDFKQPSELLAFLWDDELTVRTPDSC